MDQERREKPARRRGVGEALLRLQLYQYVIGAVVAAALCAAAVLTFRASRSTRGETAKIGFEDIGELATQAAYCREVQVTEAARELFGVTIPFTQSKYIYSYDVVIRAGVDFGDIAWSLEEDTIEVRLPEARVLSCEVDLDSFRVYHEEESIFRPITLEENNAALADLKRRAEEDAVANGLLTDARENAERILTLFFAGEYDPQEYEIRFIGQA